MNSKLTRRSAICSTTAWLAVGVPGLSRLAHLRADDADTLNVSLNPEILPLVQLIENTPREKSVAMMIGELRRGTTKPVKINKSQSIEHAVRDLRDAMDNFQSDAAESAIVALSRSTNPKKAMSELWRYAGRDDSFIGHRAIALINSWRVLESIGWQHAEPMFQFVVRQLNEGENRHLQHEATGQGCGVGVLIRD